MTRAERVGLEPVELERRPRERRQAIAVRRERVARLRVLMHELLQRRVRRVENATKQLIHWPSS